MPDGYGKLERAAAVGDQLNPLNFAARIGSGHARPDQQTQADMDKLQKVVDLIGLFEPTGIADLGNAVASLMRAVDEPDRRGEHVRSAAVSAIGAIPLIGSIGPVAKRSRSAGKSLDHAARQAARRVPGGARAYMASRGFLERHPNVGLNLIRGVTRLIRIALTDRPAADRVQATGATFAQMSAGVRYPGDPVRTTQGLVGEQFDWYLERQRRSGGGYQQAGMGPRYNVRAPAGMTYEYQSRPMGPAYVGAAGSSGRPISDPAYAYRYSDRGHDPVRPPRRRRSLMRRAGGSLRRAGGVMHRNTALGWWDLGRRGMSHVWRSPLYAYMAERRMHRQGMKVGARLGAFGPFAAEAAGGWYFSPQNVGKMMRNLGEGLLKAGAGLGTFIVGLRYTNRALLAAQSAVVPFNAQMSAAAARFAMEDAMRKARMGALTGTSYARLSDAQSNFEDVTLPYRAAGTATVNTLMANITNITAGMIDAAGKLAGIEAVANGLLDLLGADDPEILPHQELLRDIAAGKFVDGPTAPPRT